MIAFMQNSEAHHSREDSFSLLEPLASAGRFMVVYPVVEIISVMDQRPVQTRIKSIPGDFSIEIPSLRPHL